MLEVYCTVIKDSSSHHLTEKVHKLKWHQNTKDFYWTKSLYSSRVTFGARYLITSNILEVCS